MSAIAGCAQAGAHADVKVMLQRLAHRAPTGTLVRETAEATLGVGWTPTQESAEQTLQQEQTAMDAGGPGRVALAAVTADGVRLTRDRAGVAPLYYGYAAGGVLYFASEVKALLPLTRNIECLPPGYSLVDGQLRRYVPPIVPREVDSSPRALAKELHLRLSEAIRQSIDGEEMASWLSGGLDSSVIAALARPQVRRLRSFAAGLVGAADLEYARRVARYIQFDHHEIVVDLAEMLRVLPDVIYHLESFDALLVRSSIMNYQAGRAAAGYVAATLSGEGGDELFAGYAYLKDLDPALLDAELVDITTRLHNTALQRATAARRHMGSSRTFPS